MTKGFKDLKVYQLSYKSVMEIFKMSKNFPREEVYSLTDQIRRSSRSIAASISEAYRKRRYPKHFVSKLTDADSEASEVTVWLDFAKDCDYISNETHKDLLSKYEEIGKMLGSMIVNYEKFTAY